MKDGLSATTFCMLRKDHLQHTAIFDRPNTARKAQYEIIMKRYRAKILLFLLSVFSLGSLYFGSRNVWPTRRSRIINRYLCTSSIVTTPNQTTLHSTTSKPQAKFPQTKLFTTEGPSTKIVTKTFEEYIRYFVREYTNPYPRNMKHDKIFEIVRGIAKQTWRPNVSHTNAFRRDILGATKFLDSRRFLYLTKKNTKVDQNLTFGMGGLPWTVQKQFWDRLPKKTVFEKPKRFKQCSIVGSSGILAGSKCGRDIDQADFIFRFNLAPVKGHEDDVGTKTNFTTLNPSFLITQMNTLREPKDITTFESYMQQFNGSMVWLPAFTIRTHFKFNMQVETVLSHSGTTTPIFNHPGHIDAMTYLWRRANYQKNWPSSGLYVVSSALGLCDEVHLFGFWFFERSLEGARVPYHYHNDESSGLRHNRLKEFSNLVHLHKKGILKINFGKCGADS